MKKYINFIFFFLLFAFVYNSQAMTAKEIIQKMNYTYYYSHDDGKAKVSMKIVSANGQVRNREFVILRKDITDGADQLYYVYFFKPTDVRGVVFLVHKHIDRDDDRWLYLSEIDLVQRISSRDKRSAFVGSDFTYEDVSGRHLEDDEYELLGEEELDSVGCYVIKAIPRDSKEVEFAYRKIWVDKQFFLPRRVEHYDRQGNLYKVFSALAIQEIQNTPTIVKGKMEDKEKNQYTVMEFKEVNYDLSIPEDIFTERYLRKPAREWIQ